VRDTLHQAYDDIIKRAKSLSSATVHEAAGKIGNLPSTIKPLDPTFKLCGKALTVSSPPLDNLWLHRAIYEAEPGDVLMIDVGGFTEAGYWGEIMACAAQVRQIAGLVINGCVRDREQINAMNFPVFSTGLCIRGTGKDKTAYGAINQPIRMGDIVIFPGDLIVGDGDGVVVIPKAKAEWAVNQSEQRDANELQIMARLRQGERTLDLFDLN
jgi:4-hydroxy-4-methyl-2-oxoglutarate aldolase